MRRDLFRRTVRLLSRLVLGGPLALGAPFFLPAGAEGSESDLPAALERAAGEAEARLRAGDLHAAEGHYREALLDGWLLVGALERLDGRLPEARAAVRRASLFAGDGREIGQALALAYIQTGEPQDAVEILTALAAREPRDLETRRLLASALAAAGRTDQARAALDAASALASDDPEQTFLLANQYLWLRQIEAAERLFAKVVAARPMPQTHVLIGRSYRDVAEYARARGELETALRLDPSVRRAHYYLGMVALNQDLSTERLARAEAEFRAELKLAPEDPLTNDQLGQMLLDAGRAQDALAALETAVRADPRAVYLSHLGRCQLALERPADAVPTLRRALTLATEQRASAEELEAIHFQLGRALRSVGPESEARAQLAEAARLASLRRERAEQPSSGGRGPELEDSALAQLTAEQRRQLRQHVDATLARAYFNLGVIQAQDLAAPPVERYARAAASLERAAEIDPAFPQVQASLGIAYFNAREFEKAVAPLTRALAAGPADPSLKRMLATARLDTSSWAEAVRLLNDDPSLAEDPDPTLQFGRGLALLRSGRAQEAERVLTALLQHQADSAPALVLLGQARIALGRYEPAATSLERALALQPDVEDGSASLGFAYFQLGRTQQAETALRAALARRPADDTKDAAETRFLLGRVLLARGENAEALSLLEAAARVRPDEARFQEQLGQAYRRLGRKAEAERALATARTLQKKGGGEAR